MLMYKIAITGPESTGKSFLSEALAKHFNCSWVPEYAREYLTKQNGEYQQKDLTTILDGQLKMEEKAGEKGDKFLLCDSDPLVLLIWSKVKYNSVDHKIEDAWKKHDYDLHLLLYPDQEWEYDPLRENKDDRLALFTLYKDELHHSKKPYKIIKGKDRVVSAIQIIEAYFNNP